MHLIDYLKQFDEFPSEIVKEIDAAFERIIRFLLINTLKTFSDRLHAIQFQSAQERYFAMQEKYPTMLLRAPLSHIASYLGIARETPSRIRAGK